MEKELNLHQPGIQAIQATKATKGIQGIPNYILEFKNIQSEIYRVYDWLDGTSIRINNPIELNVSKNGHRILDINQISHYIPYGWKHLYWEVKSGEKHFSF